MAFNPNDNINNIDQRKGPLIGIVINNKDPLQLRRVQVKIEGLLEGNTTENTPWFRPETSGAGSRSDYGNFDEIPQVNTTVQIRLNNGDLRDGFYSAMADTSVDSSQIRLYGENYPNTYGTCDSSGTWNRTNKERGYEEHLHHSGFYAQVDKNGTFHVYIPKDVVIHVKGNAAIKVDGDFFLKALGMLGLHGDKDTGISSGATMEIISADAATIEAGGNNIDLNSGVTFGTQDTTNSVVDSNVEKVDNRHKEVSELQQAVKTSGELASGSIQTHSNSLLGTRS